MKKKKSRKRSAASFSSPHVHSDKLSAYKSGSQDLTTNTTGGPTNRADSELKHLMTHKPSGMAQANRRRK